MVKYYERPHRKPDGDRAEHLAGVDDADREALLEAEVGRLRQQNATLRARVGQLYADQGQYSTMLATFTGTRTIDQLIGKVLMEALDRSLKRTPGAKNCMELRVLGKDGEIAATVAVTKVDGKTPLQLMKEAQDDARKLRAAFYEVHHALGLRDGEHQTVADTIACVMDAVLDLKHPVPTPDVVPPTCEQGGAHSWTDVHGGGQICVKCKHTIGFSVEPNA